MLSFPVMFTLCVSGFLFLITLKVFDQGLHLTQKQADKAAKLKKMKQDVPEEIALLENVDMTPPVFLQTIEAVLPATPAKIIRNKKTIKEIMGNTFAAQWYSVEGVVLRKEGEPYAIRSTDPTRINKAKKLRKACLVNFNKALDNLYMDRLESQLLNQGVI